MNQALLNCGKHNRGVVLHESTLCSSCSFLCRTTVLTNISAHNTNRMTMMMIMLVCTLSNTSSLAVICHQSSNYEEDYLTALWFSLASNYYKSTKDDISYWKFLWKIKNTDYIWVSVCRLLQFYWTEVQCCCSSLLIFSFLSHTSMPSGF